MMVNATGSRRQEASAQPFPPEITCGSYIEKDLARARKGVRIVHHPAPSLDIRNNPAVASYRPIPQAESTRTIRSKFRVVRHHAQVPTIARSEMGNVQEEIYNRIGITTRSCVARHVARIKFKESLGCVDSLPYDSHGAVDASITSPRQVRYTQRGDEGNQAIINEITKDTTEEVARMYDDVVGVQHNRFDELQHATEKMHQVGELQKTVNGCIEDIPGLEERLKNSIIGREAKENEGNSKGGVLQESPAFASSQRAMLSGSPRLFSLSHANEDLVAVPLSAVRDYTGTMLSRTSDMAVVDNHERKTQSAKDRRGDPDPSAARHTLGDYSQFQEPSTASEAATAPEDRSPGTTPPPTLEEAQDHEHPWVSAGLADLSRLADEAEKSDHPHHAIPARQDQADLDRVFEVTAVNTVATRNNGIEGDWPGGSSYPSLCPRSRGRGEPSGALNHPDGPVLDEEARQVSPSHQERKEQDVLTSANSTNALWIPEAREYQAIGVDMNLANVLDSQQTRGSRRRVKPARWFASIDEDHFPPSRFRLQSQLQPQPQLRAVRKSTPRLAYPPSVGRKKADEASLCSCCGFYP